MTSTIKPIETHYLDFRFRSRLEARWAVLWHELGIPFEYEPEGFKLSNGVHYLPDFWIPSWNLWVEIKPDVPEEYIKGGRIADRFALDGIGTMLVVIGSPGADSYRIEKFSGHIGGSPDTIFSTFVECRRCDGFCLAEDTDFYTGWSEIGPHTCGDRNERWPVHDAVGSPRLFAAYRAARGARFEHGESGAPR